jgi:uncharacterized protein HemX
MNPLTSTLVKVLSGLLLLALLALAGAGWALKQQIAATATETARASALSGQLDAVREARARDSKAMAHLRALNAATARSEAAARRSLDRASAANPDWSSTEVPPTVREALQDDPTSHSDHAVEPSTGLLRSGESTSDDTAPTGQPVEPLP